jgi:hypothetical protein
LVVWEQAHGEAARTGWSVAAPETGGSAPVFGPSEINGGITTVLVAAGRGGFLVSRQTGEFPGDKYGPTFRPVGIWVVPVGAHGETGTATRLAYDSSGDISDGVGDITSDGRVVVAWHRNRRCWVTRGRAGESFAAPRRFGPPGFLCSSAKLVGHRVVAAGMIGRHFVALVNERRTQLGILRDSGRPPTLVAQPDRGSAVTWTSAGEVWVARLSAAGRLVGRSVVSRGYADLPTLAMDRAGRTLAVWQESARIGQRVRLAALDSHGHVRTRVVLDRDDAVYGNTKLVVAPSGRAAVSWQDRHANGASTTLALGHTNGRFSVRARFGLTSATDADSDLAFDTDGSLLVAYLSGPDPGSSVWLQRWSPPRTETKTAIVGPDASPASQP